VRSPRREMSVSMKSGVTSPAGALSLGTATGRIPAARRWGSPTAPRWCRRNRVKPQGGAAGATYRLEVVPREPPSPLVVPQAPPTASRWCHGNHKTLWWCRRNRVKPKGGAAGATYRLEVVPREPQARWWRRRHRVKPRGGAAGATHRLEVAPQEPPSPLVAP